MTANSLTAGWLITELSTDAFGIKRLQTTFIQDNLVRFETESSITILDLSQKHVTLIFSEHKAFWSGTTDEFKQSTIEAFKSQLDMALDILPESERIYYEQKYDTILDRLGGDIDYEQAPIEIVATGNFDSISSFLAYEHKVFVDTILREVIWITQDVNPYEDINIKDMIDFTNQLSPMDMRNQMTQTKVYTDLLEKGMPIKSIEYRGSDIVNTTQVVMVAKNKLNDEIFKEPKGYRKVSLINLMQMDVIEGELDDDGW